MSRTKPTEALSKILGAGQMRLRQLEHDPQFQNDVKELEAIAKRLAQAPSSTIPASELSQRSLSDDELLPTKDEEAFHDLAERFKEKWAFQPRWNDNGEVKLSIPAPVSCKISDHQITATTRSLKHYNYSDVDALEKHYLRQWEEIQTKKGRNQPVQRRFHIKAHELRLKALDMRARGWDLERITETLFEEYERPEKRWSPEADQRYRDIFNKYVRPPFSLAADSAIKRADEELRQVHRHEMEENRKLRERVRRLIGSHPKKLQR